MPRFVTCFALFTFFSGAFANAQVCSCLPPSTWVAGACVPPANINHACDDGSISGTPSVVSSSLTAGTAAAKFQSVINKKLACCLNPFDPLAPAQLKYDCVDNNLATGGSFDTLWTGSDPNDSGSEPYAIVLATGGNGTTQGRAVSGFYTMAGARCDEYSEFGGTIKSATVNSGQIVGQGEKAGGSTSSCVIVPGPYSVIPPASLTAGVNAVGKGLPWDGITLNNCKQAANMRRCPILVRAAMVATCAKNSIPPVAPKSYVDAVGVTHCLSASSIRIYLHMEQIYEIAGMPRMATVDTLRDQNNVNSISIADLILSKIGNTCQGGSTQNNGICMGCPANCGGPRCTACTGGQVSADGTITCHN